MKVYVKKEDKESMVPKLAVIAVFLGVPIILFTLFLIKKITNKPNPFGGPLLFSLIFFAIGIYIVYLLIKGPKGYKVKLVDKIFQTYHGEPITYMFFHMKEDSAPAAANRVYKCYILGYDSFNQFVEENNYLLKIKEFNWEPKGIEEIVEFNIDTNDRAEGNQVQKKKIDEEYFKQEFDFNSNDFNKFT